MMMIRIIAIFFEHYYLPGPVIKVAHLSFPKSYGVDLCVSPNLQMCKQSIEKLSKLPQYPVASAARN